ncbi:hypothetical protein HDZ31DRAFT_72437 [Schizophyllum fasciatum]
MPSSMTPASRRTRKSNDNTASSQRADRGATNARNTAGRSQRQAVRQVPTEPHSSIQGRKPAKRPASPSGDVSTAKRGKSSTTVHQDENVNPGHNVRAHRSRPVRRPPALDDDDDDNGSDGADDHDPEHGQEDDEDLVESEDDGDDSLDATLAFLDSDDEDAPIASKAATAPAAGTMTARERARRDEEPVFGDDDDNNDGRRASVSSTTAANPVAVPGAAAPPSQLMVPMASTTLAGPPSTGPTPLPAAGWHPSSWIVEAHPNQRVLSLKLQNPELQAVLRRAIQNGQSSILFTNAFPDPGETPLLDKQALVDAAESCKATGIHERLLGDPAYSLRLGPVIHTRVAILRSRFKENADNKVVGFYRLPNDNSIGDVVRRLMDQAAYHYSQKDDGSFINHKPYSNRCVTAVIQDVVFSGSGSRSLSVKLANLFFEPNSGGAQPELPIPLVALAATAVCAALDDRSSGVNNKKSTEFSGDSVINVYKDHVRALTTIRDTKPAAFHRLMADLFKEVRSCRRALAAMPFAQYVQHGCPRHCAQCARDAMGKRLLVYRSIHPAPRAPPAEAMLVDAPPQPGAVPALAPLQYPPGAPMLKDFDDFDDEDEDIMEGIGSDQASDFGALFAY